MDVRNLCIITEEATFVNGVLYGIYNVTNKGYDHYQYYSKEGEAVEDLVKTLQLNLNLPNLAYIPNPDLKDFKSNCSLSDSVMYQNTDSKTLMEQLSDIESLNNVELSHISGKNYKVYYYPRYLIYEITSMAVKLPKQVSHPTGEIEWSYEYLIYPDFTVNEDLLQELRNLTGKELPLNIEKVPLNVENRGFYRPMSPYLHKLLYMEYFRQCGISKGVTNAIRIMEHNKVAQDNLYDIYQNFRQNKNDFISYIGYDFYGPIKEYKLNEFIELAGLTKAEVGTISQDAVKKTEFINKYKDQVLYEPIIAYIENLNTSPFDAMATYGEMETLRCFIRKLIYQHNMCWYDCFNPTIANLNIIQPSCRLEPELAMVADTIMWVQDGKAWGIKKHTHKPRRKK